MIENILLLNGLSTNILESLSYRTKLEKSLKNNLHCFNREDLIGELEMMREWLFEQSVFEDIDLDLRIKSIDSINLKYDRYYPNRQVRQVFNDILGFRAFCDDYREILPSEHFRIADMSAGKANDDGYRGVHLYYQKDNFHYPIEIQFNTLYDRQINNWLHSFLYKKNFPDEIGRTMRQFYEQGKIHSAEEFEEVLNYVLHCSQTP